MWYVFNFFPDYVEIVLFGKSINFIMGSIDIIKLTYLWRGTLPGLSKKFKHIELNVKPRKSKILLKHWY